MYDIIIIRYTSNGKDYEADVHKHYPIHHIHMAITIVFTFSWKYPGHATLVFTIFGVDKVNEGLFENGE